MALMLAAVGAAYVVHVAPPSVDRSMVPDPPTAHARVGDEMATALRPAVAVVTPALQVVPALVVKRMVEAPPAASPTAMASLAVMDETPLRKALVPEVWVVKDEPPSAVYTMVPESPTSQPEDVVGNDALAKSWAPPVSREVQDPPPSEVLRMVPLRPVA
jgi:hypothetical protein